MSAWPGVLIFTALFAAFAVREMHRASTSLWFFAFAASSLPALVAPGPAAIRLDVAKHSLDAGGDVPFQISLAQRVLTLSVAFSVILAGVATYSCFARRKT
jgi:hypothetical protein